jgi:hypothetical protein
MTALALLALLLPIVAAYSLLPTLPRGKGHPADALVLRISAATGVGLGVSSVAFFLSLLLFDAVPWSVLAFDVLLLGFSAYAWRQKGEGGLSSPTVSQVDNRLASVLSLIFVGVLFVSFAGFLLASIREPHGEWDAWAIWNAKARFLARGGANWRLIFSKEMVTPDYPLLLPGTIARAWRYAGNTSPMVSMAVAGLFAAATIGLTVAALAILRGRAQGAVGGLLLAPPLLAEASHQYADVPLAFYALATMVLLALRDRHDAGGESLPFLAGVTAGMAAWTKNEGLVFLLIVVGWQSLRTLLDGGRAKRLALLWFCLGAVPFLTFNAMLRLRLLESAPPVTFLRWEAVRAQLFAPARCWEVMRTVGQQWTASGILPIVVLYAALCGLSPDRELRSGGRSGMVVLALMLVAYFEVYVITPHDLTWHVSTTLSRLMIQIAPLAVFSVLFVVRSPDDLRPTAVVNVVSKPSKDRERRSRR